MLGEPGFLLGKHGVLVCLGDSITQNATGYVAVLRHLIAAAYPERGIRVVNAGISGHKAPDMFARLQSDVIAYRPTVVTVNVGINDVWHGFGDGNRPYPKGDGPNGVPLEVYEPMVTRIVDSLHEATDAEIVLCPPTVIGEDVDNPDNLANRKLEEYVAAMHRIELSRNTLLAPTHEDFVQAIRAGRSVDPEFRLTTDGVHMNAIGDHVMALTILQTLGFLSAE